VVELLLEAGADPGREDHMGNRALDLAAANGHAETARIIEEFEE
jgi:ankyrin repeat protein